ncbi:MAG: GxxExxY protein [Candidatus Hydrogenedentes bacterium]|nr:GxxExxY protein [Candidatus Hydrogenedentota bacterium]
MGLLHEELTSQIIRAFYNIYNGLGYGFLEKVYENAMKIELEQMGLAVQTQVPINVLYKGQVVGEYFADILVNNDVIVELKAADALTPAHEAQLLNYLRGVKREVGLLLNFGPEAKFVRKVFGKKNP